MFHLYLVFILQFSYSSAYYRNATENKIGAVGSNPPYHHPDPAGKNVRRESQEEKPALISEGDPVHDKLRENNGDFPAGERQQRRRQRP